MKAIQGCFTGTQRNSGTEGLRIAMMEAATEEYNQILVKGALSMNVNDARATPSWSNRSSWLEKYCWKGINVLSWHFGSEWLVDVAAPPQGAQQAHYALILLFVLFLAFLLGKETLSCSSTCTSFFSTYIR
jgi:hypothetical protein